MFISTLTVLTEQEIMHFKSKTQSYIHCSHWFLSGRSWEILLGLEEDVPARGRLPNLPVLALEIANSLVMSDISIEWTQGSLSGSTPPSALPNSRKHQRSALRSCRNQMEYIQKVSQVIQPL